MSVSATFKTSAPDLTLVREWLYLFFERVLVNFKDNLLPRPKTVKIRDNHEVHNIVLSIIS